MTSEIPLLLQILGANCVLNSMQKSYITFPNDRLLEAVFSLEVSALLLLLDTLVSCD